MKIYGRKPRLHNYPDNHPPKGYINWWEEERILNKKTERRKAKIQTEQEAADYDRRP